ncbi:MULTISPECIES: acyl-CoA carboxylase epsilon subunit [Streptacidiphilus]|uniref:Acyl-CoA carboxylase epsilon subunit n=2 Tax=Streptacidiphilus TaxID=228398 RepID=A0ABV6UEC3_9ACTN|nr:acyl-CoA carboxylase epsilon subunit [Streptacidiphilus jeojiense]
MTTVLEPATLPATTQAAAPVDPLVRVVKGTLADEELAALTAVLLARAAATSSRSAGSAKGAAGSRTQAQWQRPERRPSYNSPVSWHR